MHHFALGVDSIDDLARGYDRLAAAGCLDGASDHGATRAVYGHDPDNNTFEFTWVLPRGEWGDFETIAPIKQPLDVRAEANRRPSTP
jgi:catechol-2,3-dioxygenase